jgi:cell division protein ZipA
MDKELLRVIIIFVGLVVVAGMILWGMVKNRRAERKGFYNGKYEDDEVDIVPLGSALDDEPFDPNYAYEGGDDTADDDDYKDAYANVQSAFANRQERFTPEPEKPVASSSDNQNIIQFGIVAKDLQGFNGMQLAVAFKSVGLTYGHMKIFERLDAGGDVLFSVASIVEPGTFPETGLDQFYCPGIVFFMQPDYLADPVAVFDQLIAVVHKLAKQLDGVEWDHKRKLLTTETIQVLREQLF